jgi:hypothetical protein
MGKVEGGGGEEGDEGGPGFELVGLEGDPAVVVAEVGVVGVYEGGGLVLEVDDSMGIVGGGVAEVAEDHFDGAVLEIEAGGEEVVGKGEELRFPFGYEAADFGGVSGKWVHGGGLGSRGREKETGERGLPVG